jgi:hypothetical protein
MPKQGPHFRSVMPAFAFDGPALERDRRDQSERDPKRSRPEPPFMADKPHRATKYESRDDVRAGREEEIAECSLKNSERCQSRRFPRMERRLEPEAFPS